MMTMKVDVDIEDLEWSVDSDGNFIAKGFKDIQYTVRSSLQIIDNYPTITYKRWIQKFI